MPKACKTRIDTEMDSRLGSSHTPEQVSGAAPQHITAYTAVVLALLVLLGAVIRFDFMHAVDYCIDGDEAIVGLMAKHIAEGRGVPTFYYGQHYMGSLEAILAAGSFTLFGVSSFALQLVPFVCSLVLIILMFFLGRAVWNQRVGLVAAALTACAPPALVVWSSKARGGFIEVVVLGCVALLLCISWIRSDVTRLRYPVLIGLVLGLGWWVNTQIVYFMVPIALIGAVHFAVAQRKLAIVIAGVSSFFLGGLAYWIYNIRLGFPSAGMFGVVGSDVLRNHVQGLVDVALPMIVGAQRFWQRAPVFPGAKVVAFCLYSVPLLLLFCVRFAALANLLRLKIDRQRPIELCTLQVVACLVIFVVSPFGGLVQAPRYLLPLYVGLFVLLGVIFEYLFTRRRGVAVLYLAALLCFQVLGSYYGGRAVMGEPVVSAGQRVARDHKPLIATLEKLGINRIRTNYWIGYRVAFETNERVTFSQVGEPLQIRIPEYESGERAERELLPLVLVRAQVPVFSAALLSMGYTFSQTTAGEYVILHAISNRFSEPQSYTVNPEARTLNAVGSHDPRMAFDGRADTRWGTGAPQAPNQQYIIELKEPLALDGIGYVFSTWWADRPRELKIEVEDVSGKRTVVLSPFEAKGAFELSIREGSFVVRFEPLNAKRIILSQLARDQVFDWSIAEIELFSPEAQRS